MKYLYWLIGLVLLAGVGIGAYYLGGGKAGTGNLTNNPSPTTESAKTYTNQKYGYAFDYPANYHLDLAFADDGYSERGGSGVMVGGDIRVSSEPFPPQTEVPSDSNFWSDKPANYTGFDLRVMQVTSKVTITQAITSVSKFINYDQDTLTTQEYKTASGLSGLARMYKVVYYDQLGPENGDLPMTPEEYNAMQDFQVKNAPTYFFKAGDKLVVIDTYGKSISLIQALVSTFRFL